MTWTLGTRHENGVIDPGSYDAMLIDASSDLCDFPFDRVADFLRGRAAGSVCVYRRRILSKGRF